MSNKIAKKFCYFIFCSYLCTQIRGKDSRSLLNSLSNYHPEKDFFEHNSIIRAAPCVQISTYDTMGLW